MTRWSQTMKRTWVFTAAGLMIAGGGVTMNFILSGDAFAENSAQVIQAPTVNAQSDQTQAAADAAAEYTLIDQAATYTRGKLVETLKAKGVPQDQLESKVIQLQSDFIPGEKDLSAEQAAAYGAGLLKKVFAANLSGYTARAGFQRGSLPGTDTWTVWFEPAGQTAARSYSVFLNSVNGTIVNASSSEDLSALKKVDVNDPVWQEKAKQAVTGLLQKNVSITGCRVTSSDGLNKIGVPVLCELSDGSAYMIGLAGANKDVANLYFFQNGYDGSLDNSINKQKQAAPSESRPMPATATPAKAAPAAVPAANASKGAPAAVPATP